MSQKLTLAELKRRLAPGTRLLLVHAPPVPASLGPKTLPVERIVQQVRSADVIFAPSAFSKGQPSYLTLPKTSCLEATERGFRIYDEPGSEFYLEYEWLEEQDGRTGEGATHAA